MNADIVTSAGNLPTEPDSFIGRERDLADLVDMIGEVRALTLCGPGGIGKTRLAVRLGVNLAPDYADGAWLVDLADARDPDVLVPLVAATFGIRQEHDRPLADTLTEALRPRSVLLILDTCEHLVSACAVLVQRLLAACPGLRVIATSRESLRIRSEVVWRVPPLGLPPSSPLAAQDGAAADISVEELASYEAVRLFVDRAAAARPGFRLGPANAAHVAALCRTLDGVPLAIELAAARVRALSVEQIAARLADRFALLASADRTIPRRQQTLRATVDWSYQLLTAAEQVLLRRLSVFAGWTLEMAEQVCTDRALPSSDVLDLLATLIDKSLVNLDGELNGAARYRLLDTIREYAADRAAAAGELSALRVAHRDCVLRLREASVDQAFVRDDVPWRDRVAAYRRGVVEQANSRAALACCADRGDAEEGLRLCIALRVHWIAGDDPTDGPAWLDRMLALDRPVSAGVRRRALSVRAELAYRQQEYQAGAGFARECLAISRPGRDVSEAAALRVIALAALMAGQVGDALDAADAAIAAARAATDQWEAGLAMTVRAAVIACQGRFSEAQRTYEAALEVLGENRSWGQAVAHYGLARLARARRDDTSALRHFGAALAMYRQIDARSEMARCLAGIGRLALAQRDLTVARVSLTESLQLSLAIGDRRAAALGIEAQAALAAAAGNLVGALKLASSSQALHTAIGEKPSAAASRRFAELVETARGRLGPERAAALLAEGQAMSPYAAVRLAEAREQLPATPGPQTGAEHQAADQAQLQASPARSEAGQADPPAGARQDDPSAVLPPAADQLAADQPAADQPAADQPAADQPAADQPAAGLLTERQRQVAAMVARGLSNRAIADELGIAEVTAARHVANIYTKLGLNSRAQLAAWVGARHRGQVLPRRSDRAQAMGRAVS